MSLGALDTFVPHISICTFLQSKIFLLWLMSDLVILLIMFYCFDFKILPEESFSLMFKIIGGQSGLSAEVYWMCHCPGSKESTHKRRDEWSPEVKLLLDRMFQPILCSFTIVSSGLWIKEQVKGLSFTHCESKVVCRLKPSVSSVLVVGLFVYEYLSSESKLLCDFPEQELHRGYPTGKIRAFLWEATLEKSCGPTFSIWGARMRLKLCEWWLKFNAPVHFKCPQQHINKNVRKLLWSLLLYRWQPVLNSIYMSNLSFIL